MYTYTYGNNNELQNIGIPGVGSITIPEYTWTRPASMVYPGGMQRTASYDALMRLQSLTVTDPVPNAAVLQPVNGRTKPRFDRMYFRSHSPIDIPYFACPDSKEAVKKAINDHSTGKFNLINYTARNCTGWVCQVLSEAGWAPETGVLPGRQKLYLPRSATLAPDLCATIGIRPMHLTPGGWREPLDDIDEILNMLNNTTFP